MNKIFLILIISGILFPIFSINAQGLFTKDLYFGIWNDSEIIKLQEFLTDEGLYSGPITGNFFSLTLKAVKSFQVRENISPTAGYFGPITRTRANQILSVQIESSEKQAISETGATPELPIPPKTTDDIFNSLQSQISTLLQQIALLQQQLQSQKQIEQQITQQSQQITQQTQIIQQQQTALEQIQQNTTPPPASAPPVPPPPPPLPKPTIEFSSRGANYGNTIEGKPLILTWSSTDAETCIAFGSWSGNKPVSGSEELIFQEAEYNKKFVLSCKNSSGETIKTIIASVYPLLEIQEDSSLSYFLGGLQFFRLTLQPHSSLSSEIYLKTIKIQFDSDKNLPNLDIQLKSNDNLSTLNQQTCYFSNNQCSVIFDLTSYSPDIRIIEPRISKTLNFYVDFSSISYSQFQFGLTIRSQINSTDSIMFDTNEVKDKSLSPNQVPVVIKQWTYR